MTVLEESKYFRGCAWHLSEPRGISQSKGMLMSSTMNAIIGRMSAYMGKTPLV
jgi:hypothetical protein